MEHAPVLTAILENAVKRNLTVQSKNVYFACLKILNLFISISNLYSLFLTYSFGTEKINTFIHSRSSLENSYPIPDQNGQGLCPFSGRNGAETLHFVAAHTYMTYRRKYPPLGCILSKFTALVLIYFLPVPTDTDSSIRLAFLAQASLPHCRLKIVNNI